MLPYRLQHMDWFFVGFEMLRTQYPIWHDRLQSSLQRYAKVIVPCPHLLPGKTEDKKDTKDKKDKKEPEKHKDQGSGVGMGSEINGNVLEMLWNV